MTESWVSLPRRDTQDSLSVLPTDIAWLAGLLEGEGSFMVWKNHKPKKTYFYPTISVNMTDKDIIDRVANLFGTQSYVFKKAYGVSKKPSWRAMVRGKNAVAWMKLLLPYMGERRAEKINEILESLT